MKAREYFGVAVRLLGVWFWSQAVYWAFWAYLKGSEIGIGNPNISAREDLAHACIYLLLGTALFLGSTWLVWLAYGAPSTTQKPGAASPAE
jgi:hypothetical protein